MSPPSREDIIDWALNGSLLQRASNRFGLHDLATFREAARTAAELANDGRFDLLGLFSAEGIGSLQKRAFFPVQQFFCDALPGLKAPVEAVLPVVDRLVAAAGADLAANLPNGALLSWCVAEPSRAKAIVDQALEGETLPRRFITFALQAGGYVDEARRLAEADDRELKLCAIAALGRTPHEEAALAETLATFDRVLAKGADDVERANILAAAVNLIYAKGRLPANAAEADFLTRAFANAGDQTLHQLATALWLHAGMAEGPVLSAALAALRSLNPTHRGTLEQLDLALQGLVERGRGEAATSFMVELAAAAPEMSMDEAFDSFFLALLADPALLPYALVQFLMSGCRSLSDGIAHYLSVHRRDEPLSAPAALLDRLGVDRRLLSRKIAGYLFLLPVPATSLLVSVIEASDMADATYAAQLLYRWLLVNYEAAREHLATVKPAGKAARRLLPQLRRAQKAYVSKLDAVAPVRELAPSERRREVERIKAQERSETIRKGAQEKSVFFGLVKRSILLYGTGSISYVNAPDGTLRPISMDLKSMGVSWEMPRLDWLDPLGMAYQLERFRAEAVR